MHEHLVVPGIGVGDAVGLLVAGVCGLLVAVGFFVHWRVLQAKIAANRAWAARHGFSYIPFDSSVASVSSAEPFGIGWSRRGVDVYRGKYRNFHVMFFRYDYAPTFGKGTDTVSHQVVALALPASRPLLDIGHEGFWSKRFGDGIDFENQAFNDRFKIRSGNGRFAFDVINARTMEWMLADQRAQAYRWRFEGPWLMTFRLGELKLEEVFFYADFLIDVYAQVPRHVWSTQ
ncbi:hypothetical protein [Glycomyces salinus]|uniref:hypothetical protein n=1 Tax=Glycomyces salinus TaxID=980294 RepID=UPI0018EC85E3|nr:hypothetical protein [Glycomyces salinus]